ncbi:hypothetical protein KR074_004355 [Drosophila pseudoananassae]|nr:hypothetical protein KR074_004355 [Drosophila pseudoananassae]
MWLVRNLYFGLFLLMGYLGESVDGRSDVIISNYGDFYGNATGSRWFRFRDFEPRHLEVEIPEMENREGDREGRGFHFHASGEDVSVELEFIVPFAKIPVKRSMNLARDAVQSILNLRTGAILNTAVVVAAGAVIAAVVRLVLAPLVVTSIGNGYAYKSDSERGMRRLTDVVESQLEEHNIDMSVCIQRWLCQYLQKNLSAGYSRVLNVLTNAPWLHPYVNGTAVFHAIETSQSDRSCSHTYLQCRWQNHWTSGGAIPQIMKFFNG